MTDPQGVVAGRLARLTKVLAEHGIPQSKAVDIGWTLIHDGWAWFGQEEPAAVVEAAAVHVERAAAIVDSLPLGPRELGCPCDCWSCTENDASTTLCQHRGITCAEADVA